MSVLPGRRAALLLLSLTLGAVQAQTLSPPQPVKKVLFFTKSSGFEHGVIKEVDGKPSFAARVLAELGPRHGIAFTMSKDGSKFTPAYLAQFDAYLFYTSGDLLAAGTDGHPPMTAEGKAALLAAVAGGKGFIGTHSATDTFHAGETAATPATGTRASRYRNLGPLADPYTRLVGAEFIMHGAQQSGRMQVVDRKFPGLAALGEHFDLHEEWYALTDFSPDLHVLLVQDTAFMGNPDRSAGNSSYARPAYPSTWARLHGQGRVFYTAMGHREDVWTNPLFQQILFGGIAWAVRNVEADVGPNLATAAPRAAELPAPWPAK